MKASDVMTPRVVTIHGNASVEEGARLMLQEGVTGLPVVDHEDVLVGIVTEGDFLRRSPGAEGASRPGWLEMMINPAVLSLDYAGSHARRVSEVMSRGVITVSEDTALEVAATTMERHGVRRLVVMRGKAVMGIINRSNLLQALAKPILSATFSQESDRAIREEIVAEFGSLAWMPSASVNPMVWEGVVYLHGTVRHERERAALKFIARSVTGVASVEDHLVQIEPYFGMRFRRAAEACPDYVDLA